jgi:branched-chain amino acid transport system ATP-binding protein
VGEDADTNSVVPLLEVTDLTIRFGGVRAVQDVSLRVAPGQVYGMIGPNGAGKTSLFDAVSGHNRAASGRIHLSGRDVTDLPAASRARLGLRRTFQRQQTIGWLTVEDNVLLGSEWRGGGGGLMADLVSWPSRRSIENERRDVVREVLGWCGLEGLGQRPVGSLPIGQARLVELARAVVDRPTLLLLDEPTSGMAPAGVETVREVMEHVRREFGASILLVEHDVQFVMSVCDRIAVLNLGTLIADDVPDAIRNDATVQTSYFGRKAS